jgi:hypothetical protein
LTLRNGGFAGHGLTHFKTFEFGRVFGVETAVSRAPGDSVPFVLPQTMTVIGRATVDREAAF